MFGVQDKIEFSKRIAEMCKGLTGKDIKMNGVSIENIVRGLLQPLPINVEYKVNDLVYLGQKTWIDFESSND